ncbi:MAG: hypothetical protein R3A10_03085 [Caldilineaceae bacterium]
MVRYRAPLDVPAVKGMDPKTGEAVERQSSVDELVAALVFKIVTDPFVGRLAMPVSIPAN